VACGVTDMPFAGHQGGVPCGFEHFGEGDATFVETAAVAGLVLVSGHETDSRLVGVEAGEQSGAGGAAARAVVKIGEAQTVGGESVKVRGCRSGAEAADVGVAHVIGQNDNDVGLCRLRRYR
jgi:hypothetical protein